MYLNSITYRIYILYVNYQEGVQHRDSGGAIVDTSKVCNGVLCPSYSSFPSFPF